MPTMHEGWLTIFKKNIQKLSKTIVKLFVSILNPFTMATEEKLTDSRETIKKRSLITPKP
jgi:hypothetical protein